MNVAYLGPLKDYSGYGEANRHAAAALDAAGVNVQAQLVSYTSEGSEFGAIGKTVERLLANDIDYRIKILHTTPDQYRKHMEAGKYHIGHFFWETDRVPEDFAAGLQLMDEIWTGSKANRDALLCTGVDKPVYIYPQAFDTDREWPPAYKIPEFEGFVFYSIFEWTDRKNPEGLLQAFWEEFEGRDDVCLLLKTYFNNFTAQNKRKIRRAIEGLKARSGVKHFPPVFLYLDLMDRRQIERFHVTGDCYVTPHRGEGWGIPIVEAMAAGKPVITTSYGGVAEYLTDTVNAMKLPYELVPLRGMSHSSKWYTSDQKWAQVEHDALRACMRIMFDDKAVRVRLGAAGQAFVNERFNLQRVGSEMADRLRVIEEGL